ncbi:antigen peptide transporter 2-like [Protopterus annectens]|uniref:antigen peptide transporter 2-like n=1 Tax=Protopterus annectens TaxID=7888 RepID=UPI001CFBE5FD|nr:antigen peptide transporter 2-like [Protopterus annectens]
MMPVCFVLLFILSDTVIHYLLHYGLLCCYPQSDIGFVWVLGLARLPLMCSTANFLLQKWDARPEWLRKLYAVLYTTVLCLTVPVYETWKAIFSTEIVSLYSALCLSPVLHLTAMFATVFWEFLFLGYSESAEGKTQKKAAKATFKRLLIYSKPDTLILAGAFIFLTLAVAMETSIPYYTGKIIDILGSKYDQAEFFAAIFCLSAYSMGSSISAGLRGGLFMFTLSRLTQRIRNFLFSSLVRQEVGFFESTKTGHLTSRLSVDTPRMSRSIAANVNIFLRYLVKTLGTYYFILAISWQLTALTIIESLVSGLIQMFYNPFNKKIIEKIQDSIAQSNSVAEEIISSIKTVRSFATEEEENQRYQSKLEIMHVLNIWRDTARAAFIFSRRSVILYKGVFNGVMFEDSSPCDGHLTSRLSVDTPRMSRSIAANVNIFLHYLVKTLGTYYFILTISWQLTALTIIESLVSGLIQMFYNPFNKKIIEKIQDSIAQSNSVAEEIISSIKMVRSFATEEEENQRYQSKLEIMHVLNIWRDTARAAFIFSRRLIQLSMQVAMLYYGRHLIQGGYMSSGSLVAFIMYQKDLGTNIRALFYVYGEMIQSIGAAEKVFQYLDRQPAISTNGVLKPDRIRGHIQFNNVSFCYPTRSEIPVLKNVSFEVNPGEITALVGPSGGGKSTCVGLLERFYEPNSGEILLDGKSLHEYDHKYLHSKVSLVQQDPILFATTIKENISYGLCKCDTDDVTAAAVKANAHSFIQGMEKGYETDVGEKGGQLSGGQKQQIAIARSLIRDPQVLILDEATSCLDSESEHLIQEALSSKKNQTVLIIAHRLKTVKKADKIIVIQDGAVIEEGTHVSLMEKKGCYYRLVQRTFNTV